MMKISGMAICVLLGLAGCSKPARDTTLQGYVTTDLLKVSAETAGRIETLGVEEGQSIVKNVMLFTQESQEQTARQFQAQAQVAQAQSSAQDLLDAQRRPAEIAALRARVDQAQANLTLADQDLQRQSRLFRDGWIAKARLDQSRASRDAARASVQAAMKDVQAAQLSARSAQIAAARSRVLASRADASVAGISVSRRTIVSPVAATVQDILHRPGEVVGAGQTVIALAVPERLRIRFYVPQAMLAKINLGDKIQVTCDGCAGVLAASLSYISPETEYTPPVIYSIKERAKFVVLVEARPIGAALSLKPGQPVTVDLARP